MGFLSWIVVGIIAGALAKLILPGKQGGGFIVTMILGIVGAFIGGAIGGSIMGFNTNSGFNFTTIIWATIGALIVAFVWGFIQRKSAGR